MRFSARQGVRLNQRLPSPRAVAERPASAKWREGADCPGVLPFALAMSRPQTHLLHDDAFWAVIISRGLPNTVPLVVAIPVLLGLTATDLRFMASHRRRLTIALSSCGFKRG